MNPLLKAIIFKVVIPIVVPLIVGVGGVIYSTSTMTEKLSERVVHLEQQVTGEKLLTRTINLETQIERHEKALERDFARHEQTVLQLGAKTEDQERRLTRLETLVGETQRLLAEIRADVKLLLRGEKN